MVDNSVGVRYTVYKHTSPNGKSYIGITSMCPKDRWKNGKGYSHNTYFTNAIEKYGWDNFAHEILADGLTQEEAHEMEVELIKKHNTFDSNDGYNLTSGGEVGKQHTEETRRKQSELAKRLWKDETYRNAHLEFLTMPRNGELNPNYGNHKLAGENHPNYGKKRKPEIIEKMREAALNMSDETKEKMSVAAKKRFENPEVKEFYRQLATGRHPSEESKQKMSESQRARWDDESRAEYSERFSGEGNPMYGRHHTEETKQLLREMFSGENSVWFGRHHTEESKQKLHDACAWKVPVIKLTLNGEFVEEFDSYAYAAQSVNGKPSGIIGCCEGHAKSAYGYMWVKKEDYDCNVVKKYTNNVFRIVVRLTKEWEYIDEYESLADAERERGLFSQNIGRSCKTKGVGTCGGYRWMYKEDYLAFIKQKKGEEV